MKAAQKHAHLPTSQIAAAESGSLLYFTGKPCKRGHLEPRKTVTGGCVECTRLRGAEHRERIRKALAQASQAA